MMTEPNSLILIAFAPALVGADNRALVIVRGMEQALPGLHLDWRVSKEGSPIALPQRDAWLLDKRSNGGFPLVCNGDESYPVTIAGWEKPAGLTPDGQPQLQIHVELPLDEAVIAAAEGMLEGVTEGARALWAHATPNRATGEIAHQTRHSEQEPFHHPRGLPPLKLSEDLRSPETPHRLGWLNYWSAAAARAIGFPDPARDAELLSRSRRTASGGWIVPLTEAPLDLDNPAHLGALLRAYDRFPAIGGRDA